MAFEHEKKAIHPLGVDMNMKVCICNGYRGNGTVVNRLTPVTQERNEETVCQVRALCSNLFKNFLQQTHLYYLELFYVPHITYSVFF